jgi:hypothetical protein
MADVFNRDLYLSIYSSHVLYYLTLRLVCSKILVLSCGRLVLISQAVLYWLGLDGDGIQLGKSNPTDSLTNWFKCINSYIGWSNQHGTGLPVSKLSNDKATTGRLRRLIVLTVMLNCYSNQVLSYEG